MVEIITDAQLSSYLQLEVTDALTLIAEKVNDLVTEAWVEPIAPVPVRVWSIAMSVAARAASNPKGLTSWTRSWDDISRTERVEGGASRRFGLFLTDEELAELNGGSGISPAGTIQTPTRAQLCHREPLC